jgi:hypothetical protein
MQDDKMDEKANVPYKPGLPANKSLLPALWLLMNLPGMRIAGVIVLACLTTQQKQPGDMWISIFFFITDRVDAGK